MFRFPAILLFLCFFTAAYAADTTELRQLYRVLRDKDARQSADFRWQHRAILYKALGIEKGAPDSVVALRMRTGWQELANVRISGNDEPPVYFHEVLHYALKERYGPLLLDAARWTVDMNEMDMAAHKTLLDWLEEEFRNNHGDADAEWLREYKKVFLDAGAKYFVELNYRMQQLAKRYDRIRRPLYGAYAVSKNGKWGWVNENGKAIIPLRYKAVRYTNGREFEVSDDGKNFRWTR